MTSLEGQVALVTDGGGPLGRAIALALAARGVAVVVAGPQERPLGETVGEIAYGGGKARHVVTDLRDRTGLSAAAARAVEVFGRLDVVVAAGADDEDVKCTERATAAFSPSVRVTVALAAEERGAPDHDALAQRVVERCAG